MTVRKISRMLFFGAILLAAAGIVINDLYLLFRAAPLLILAVIFFTVSHVPDKDGLTPYRVFFICDAVSLLALTEFYLWAVYNGNMRQGIIRVMLMLFAAAPLLVMLIADAVIWAVKKYRKKK